MDQSHLDSLKQQQSSCINLQYNPMKEASIVHFQTSITKPYPNHTCTDRRQWQAVWRPAIRRLGISQAAMGLGHSVGRRTAATRAV